MVGRRCRVCAHPELRAINSGMRAGESIHEMARRFHLTRYALMRHRADHAAMLTLKEPKMPAEAKKRARLKRVNRQPFQPPASPEAEADAKEHFLVEYAAHGDFLGSALAAGITRATIQVWLEHDEEFSLRFHQAKAAVVDQLEATALDRAIHGAKLIREVWRADRLIERVIEWRPQETTLVKLLQALKPEVYGEKLQVTQTQIVKTVDSDAWVAV